METPKLSQQDIAEIRSWQSKIQIANNNNIFCYCRTCKAEWVDSSFAAVCNCGSSNVEHISCWQFPDD